ncbi:hypothetical protein [Larkinella humicola]|nr:hypothetical protein [Larkinella humicola]
MNKHHENVSWARTYRPSLGQKLGFWVGLVLYPVICLYRLLKRQLR